MCACTTARRYVTNMVWIMLYSNIMYLFHSMYSIPMHAFQEVKVFVGLGFPYEGPAPLEAISHGCFFLNPKLSPPHNRFTTERMKAKPTLRSLTSQNPYTADFIGEPYVYTINIENRTEVAQTLESIMQRTVSYTGREREREKLQTLASLLPLPLPITLSADSSGLPSV